MHSVRVCVLPSGHILFTQKTHARTNPMERKNKKEMQRESTKAKASFINEPQDKRERRSKAIEQSRDEKEKNCGLRENKW